MPREVNTTINAQTGKVTEVVVPWTADTLADAIHLFRRQIEEGGTTELDAFSQPTGKTLDTSRESQALITGAVVMSTLQPTKQFVWTFADGSREQRSAFDVQRIGLRVGSHVEQSRAREAALVERIKAGEDLETIAADMHNGWPE